MVATTETKPQAKDPLTQSDRELIAEIINSSDLNRKIKPDEIITLRIVWDGEAVWIKLIHGFLAFDFHQFKKEIARLKEIKKSAEQRTATNLKPDFKLQSKPKSLKAGTWYFQESLVWIGKVDRSSFWVHDCRVELGILVDGWEEAKALRKHLLNQPQHWLSAS